MTCQIRVIEHYIPTTIKVNWIKKWC